MAPPIYRKTREFYMTTTKNIDSGGQNISVMAVLTPASNLVLAQINICAVVHDRQDKYICADSHLKHPPT